ncbi:hypothetical protein D3C72_491720 [compost metagenome]
MDKAKCQAVLENGGTLEGNGFRIYPYEKKLIIQDLLDGEYARLPIHISRATASQPEKLHTVQGKKATIENCALIADLVAHWTAHVPQNASIPIGTLAAELLQGNEAHPEDASPLIPRVGSCLHQTPWERHDEATIRRVLKATTVLALMGGDASWEDLRSELRSRGFSDDEASGTMKLASLKGRIRRVRDFPFDRYKIEVPKPFDVNTAARRPRIPSYQKREPERMP